MNWLRFIMQIVAGGIGGVIGATYYFRRRTPAPSSVPRRIPAPLWVGTAVMALKGDNFLDVSTANTVAGLNPNQGRFLSQREFKPTSDTDVVAIPFDACLDDVPNDTFVYRDKRGSYHLLTLGDITPARTPEADATCIEAVLHVTPWDPTS